MPDPAEIAACACRRPQPGCVVLHVTGELDACSTPCIEEQVLGHLVPGDRKVVLDLSEVGFLDSTGIRLVMVIISRKKHLEEVVIVGPSGGAPRRALEIVGLGRFVRMAPSVEEALAPAPCPAGASPSRTP